MMDYDDLVEKLREGCIYYERNKLFVVDDGATDNLLSSAADLIERQREALRMARAALVVGGVSDKFIEEALAAIDAALKETGGE